MKTNREKGAALALVTAFTALSAFLACGIIIMLQIFGAHREGQHAGDSGSLGVAKQAIKRPSIRDGSASGFSTIRALGDPSVGGEVNLLTYNRLVGAAMLVLLNAQAEGTPQAASNAQALLDELQKGPNSMAGKLAKALRDGNAGSASANTYELKTDYEKLTDAHLIKMAGSQSTLDRTKYDTGYYSESDASPSNILLSGMPSGLNFDSGAQVSAPAAAAASGADGKSYIRGYSPIPFTVAGQTLTLFGVPTYPGQAPHLISSKDFKKQNPGGNIADLPPNAFLNQSTLTQRGSANGSLFTARSVVGVVDANSSFSPRIRRGYLVIDNRGTGSGASFTPTGSSVLTAELGTGIYVFGSYPNAVFSTDQAALLAWSNYDHSGPAPAERPANTPSIENIKFTDGSNATWQQCWNLIAFGGTPALCNDLNSGSSPCSALIDPHAPATQGPFDLAYHNGANLIGVISRGNGLLAVEIAKIKVWEAFFVPPFSACVNNAGSRYFSAIFSTGLRLFPTGHVPWYGQEAVWGPPGGGFASVGGNTYSQPQSGQVTTDGTLQQLLDQSFGSGDYFQARGTAAPTFVAAGSSEPRPTTRVRNFIENRIRQIKPNATAAEIEQVMNTTIQFGHLYFVYSTSADQIVCTEAPPPDYDSNVNPDGVLRRFIKRYDLAGVMANPQHDNNIHDHLFMNQIPPGVLFGFNTVAVHPGTGARNGALGVIRLQNDAGCFAFPGYSSTGIFLAAGRNTGDFNLCNRN